MKSIKLLHPIYTIGHSTTSKEKFLASLKALDVDMLLDVRSSPYSRHAPQFNRQAITEWLAAAGMKYVFGGKSLGGRPTDQSLYEFGRASYQRMSRATVFLTGLRRLVVLARRHSIALLCAEPDPLECHRFLLISRALHGSGISVTHILPDGSTETHEAAERRLIRVAGLSQADLFSVSEDAIEKAYEIQEDRFAFRSQPLVSEPSWSDGFA